MKPLSSLRSATAAALIGAVAVAWGSIGPAAAQSEIKIGLLTINEPQHWMGERFIAEIEKRTNGRIKGKLFPAGQLGSIPRQIEGVQLGTQEGFITPPGFLQGVNEAFTVTDAPGMFDDLDHAFRAISDPSFRDRWHALGAHANVIGVSAYASAFNSIASREPFRKISDMAGKKIRVLASKTEIEMAKRLGFAGIPMSYNEVLPAIQQGTLDGALSAHTVMATSKFASVTKYVTYMAASFIPSVLYMHKTWLDKLPQADREVVLAVGRELERPMTNEAIKFAEEAWKIWRADGAEIIQLSAADRADMVKKLAPIGDEILGTNPKTKELYEILKAAALKHKKAS